MLIHEQMRRRLQYLDVHRIATRLLAGHAQENAVVPEAFLVNHISSAFIGMVQWWMACNLRQTPEELAGYFAAVIEPVV